MRVVGEITRLNPHEQFMSDWINTNVPMLGQLQGKERQALELIRQAEARIVQAETVANTKPVDASRDAALIQ